MHESRSQSATAISLGWAALAVGLMLLGRWTPDRLFASGMSEIFWSVKFAVLLALTVVVALPRFSGPADRRVPSLGVFLPLMAYVLASYFWNPVQNLYAGTKLADLSYNVALMVVVAMGLARPALRTAFWSMLVGVLGLMALIGVVTLPTAVTSSDDGRLSVLGGGPNIFGRNMAMLLVACLFFGFNKPKVRAICAGLAGAALIGLIASGSRGALVATLLGLLALFALDLASRRFMLTRPLLVGGFIAFGSIAALLADLGVVAEIGNQRILQQTLEGGYLSSRDVLFAWAYEHWQEAPIFGNGLGSFSLVTHLEYPHNIVMEFLSETGIVGLLLFLIFAASAAFKQARAGGRDREMALVLALVALLGSAALASGDLVDSRILFLFMLYPVSAQGAIRERPRGRGRVGKEAKAFGGPS